MGTPQDSSVTTPNSQTTGGGGILIVHPQKPSLAGLRRILGAARRGIRVAESLDAARQQVAVEAPALIVVHASLLLPDDAAPFVSQVLAHGAQACIVVADPAELDRCAELIAAGQVTNLVTAESGHALGHELTITSQKILTEDIFGLEKYLGWSADIVERALDTTEQRPLVLDSFAADLRDRGLGDRLARLARTVADELLSNALFNAPVDGQGNHTHSDEPRSHVRALGPDERVTFRYGFDASYLAIEVTDRFGSLDPQAVADYLTREIDPETVRSVDRGGAGIGLSMAYRMSDQLVINLARDTRCQFIALYDLDRAEQQHRPSRSYNLFIQRVGPKPRPHAPPTGTVVTQQSGRLQVQVQEADNGQEFLLTGYLDENTSLTEVMDELRTRDQVIIDTSAVEGINSLGVRQWLLMLAKLQRDGVSVVFRRCSEMMVHQMNMIPDTARGVTVESFLAPYSCDDCDREENVCLHLAEHHENLLAGQPPDQTCEQCGAAMEFLDLPERYFLFVANAGPFT